MSDDAAPPDVQATLAAWRAQGAQRLDPVRLRLIEAMARRGAAYQGEARRRIDARLAALMADFGRRLDGLPQEPDRTAPGPAPGPLAELAARLAPAGAAPAELKAVRAFRRIFTRVNAQRRLSKALAQAPANAGPLNSHQLVHRSLTLMQAQAPGYLAQFTRHVEALMGLEALQAAPAAVSAAPPAGARAERRRVRRASR
ncbi:MAG: DUF2894 domain-containing protein [Xenophilus sp.]